MRDLMTCFFVSLQFSNFIINYYYYYFFVWKFKGGLNEILFVGIILHCKYMWKISKKLGWDEVGQKLIPMYLTKQK